MVEYIGDRYKGVILEGRISPLAILTEQFHLAAPGGNVLQANIGGIDRQVISLQDGDTVVVTGTIDAEIDLPAFISGAF